MISILKEAREYTREEFLNEAAKSGSLFLCPRYSGLNQKCLSSVYDEKKCRECWKEAVKDITFKGEELTAICINDKTERDKRIKMLGITEGKEYQVKPSRYANYYELVNDLGQVEIYFMNRFEIIKTPGEKMQDFHKNNKTWFQQAMENVQPKVKEQLQKAINNYFEGDKMEDKTIKVRCIGDVLDFTIGNAYIGTRTESGGYLIVDNLGEEDFYYKSDFKGLFEIIEDVLMVECVDTGLYEDITKDKEYKVIEEERSAYYIYNDYQVGKTYPKNLFKPVEPQKEPKEYTVMEVLDFPVGTQFKDKEGYVLEVVQAIGGLNGRELKCTWILNRTNREVRLVLSTYWKGAKFILIEEPKPVTTAEAFKALDEGKEIESIVSGSRYKKENGLICAKNLEVYSRTSLIYGSELEGQWIIIEGDK